MVLLKRQKIVYKPLPTPIASFQQQLLADGEPPADGTAEPPANAAASSSSSASGPKKKGAAAAAADEPPADEADKKEEVVTARKDVYYLRQTGEIFLDYESYATRMAFYRQKTFQCEVTGHSGLTYFQALKSEEREARLLHERFPGKLKGPLLRAVQFQLIGRMDRLIDVVHDRFATRFFDGERVFVDVNGDKYHAMVMRTYPPAQRAATPAPFSSPVKPGSPSTNSTLSLSPPPSPREPHAAGSDLRLSQEDADKKDDPLRYLYSVQLVDALGRIVGKNGETGGEGTMWMEVKAEQLSRDRLAFSKSILKRFLRDCLDRDATAATSPWVVKPALAEKFDIPTEMSDAFKKEVDEAKEAAAKRRKRKVVEEEPAAAATGAEETEQDEKVELGEDGLPLPPKKRKRRTKNQIIADKHGGVMPDTGRPPQAERKKPVKYPAEDFLCSLSTKEIKDGKPIQRPLPHRELPFGPNFETFVMTWNFLNSFGKTLVLSPFSLDDFESSLHYDQADPVHPLTVEIHATLLNLISSDPIMTRPVRSYGQKWSSRTAVADADEGGVAAAADGTITAPASVAALEDDEMENGRSVDGAADEDEDAWTGPHGLTEVRVVSQAQEVARKATWMMGGELRVKDSRRRWESWLVGCIVDRADIKSFPEHLTYLAELLFTDDEDDEDETPSWTVTDSPVHESGPRPAMPSTRYHLLRPEAKLEIIAFLCDLAMQTKFARDAMEESMAQLTEVRKEMQDVKRDRRKVAEDRLLLDPPADKVDSDNAAAAATAAPNFNPPSSINGDSALDAMSVDGDASKSAPPINGRHAGGAPLPGDDGDSDLSGLSGDEDDDGASRAPPKSDADDGLSELADESRIESEMDDVSETASVSSRQPSARPMSSLAIRQQALKAQQQAKEAEAAARAQRIADHRAEVKAKTATSKQLSQERRRLEDEDARLAKREEALHRDFRKQINFPRARALGVDRFGNKVWWFDGTGAASLIGPGGVVLYGTGRLFLQGGDPQTRQFWGRKCDVPDDEILERRKAEEGEQGMLAEGEWVVYEDPAEITAFLQWLNPKGNRETKLIDTLRRWWDYIHRGAEKRWADLQSKTQVQHAAAEQRRSTRTGQGADPGKHHSSLQWRNRKADPGPR